MSEKSDLEALNKFFGVTNELQIKLQFEEATFQGRQKLIKHLQTTLKQNIKENTKKEEELIWCNRIKNEHEKNFKENEILIRIAENKKNDLESQLIHKQAQHEEKNAHMEKTFKFYKNKCEETQLINEATPMAVKKNNIKNNLKLIEFTKMMLTEKLDSLQKSFKLYRAIKEKRLQMSIIKFAQAMTDETKNEKNIKQLKNDIGEFRLEINYLKNEIKSTTTMIEDLQKQKIKKINEQSMINLKKSPETFAGFQFSLPLSSFNVPFLELPMNLDEKTQDNLPYTQRATESPDKYLNMKSLQSHQIENFYQFNAEAVVFSNDEKIESEHGDDAKKHNSPKIKIISNVKLNNEESEKILEEYIHKIPQFNKQVNMIVGEIEIDTKNNEMEMDVDENENKLLQKEDETQENIDNDIIPDVCCSKSKYFEDEFSGTKMGFTHSSPNDQMQNIAQEDSPINKIQSATDEVNENDKMFTLIEPTQFEETQMEVSPEETPKCIASPIDDFNESGPSGVQKQSLDVEISLDLPKYYENTAQTQIETDFNDSYINKLYAEANLGSRYLSPSNDENSIDFEKLKLQQHHENVAEEAPRGFFEMFKKNTSDTATKDGQNKSAFNFNFSAERTKTSTFPHFF